MDQHGQEQFLQSVSQILKQYPVDSVRGLKASEVGLRLRDAGLDWRLRGYLQLKDMLADLAAEGLVRVGYDDKHALSVWVTDTPRQVTEPEGARPTSPSLSGMWCGPFRPLRKAVWTAFVSSQPPGRRFISRASGFVRVGQDTTPEPHEEWVEITPIEQREQREWAEGFLQDRNLSAVAELREALSQPDWYRCLPMLLGARVPADAAYWNRLRTRRVLERVQQWREHVEVSDELVYEEVRNGYPKSRATVPARPANLRQSLLNAVERMRTDELLHLCIPARYLVEVLRPDLVGPKLSSPKGDG